MKRGREHGMKKYAVLMIINAVVLIFVTHFFFYNESETNALAYRFTLVYPQAWDKQWYQLPEVFDSAGANVKCVSFQETNEEEQIEALQKAIYAHADGIITMGTNTSEALAEVINAAEEEGIPVILVDSDLPETNRSGYVGADNRVYGKKAGEDMVEATQAKAKIGIIVSRLDNPNQAERVEGFCDAIRSYEDMEVIQILECGADRIKVRKMMQEMLKEYPDIDALYCTEPVSSEMAGEVLEDMGYGISDMQVICSAMSEEIWGKITEGRYYSAIVQNVYEQKDLAVVYLKSYLNGKNDGADVIYTEINSVKKDFAYDAWAASMENGEAVWKE